MTGTSEINREILETIAAAKIRLRFDKVARRLIETLDTSLKERVPDGQAVVFTLTAPIRLPAKTVATIEGLVRSGLPDSEIRKTIHGNEVRLRHIPAVRANMPKVMGFVHNPDADPGLILALAEARLVGQR